MLQLSGAGAVLNLLDEYKYLEMPAFVVDVAQNHFTVSPEEVKLLVYLFAYPNGARSCS